jgi:hypothetical protein
MPEYLAPAVYVEEVDTGSKPIEGVSTSTAGFIGVTERGPVDVPILVTSYGEYRRWFGEGLNPALYANAPADTALHHLPQAVQGFFTNGGKRLYVNRILNRQAATAAERFLVAAPAAGAAQSVLLRGMAPGDAVALVADATGMAAGQSVQVGAGANAELATVGAAVPAETISLRLPLSQPHAAAQNVRRVTLAAGALNDQLAVAAAPGDAAITLQTPLAAALAGGELLALGAGASEELVVAGAAAIGVSVVPLRAPVQLAHAVAAPVVQQTVTLAAQQSSIAANADAAAGDTLVVVASNAGLDTAGDALVFATGTANAEYRRVGALARADLAQPSYADLPAGALVEALGPPPAALAPALDLTANADAGASIVRVSSRPAGMAVGDVIAVGLGAEREYVRVASLPAVLPPPNAGAIVLAAPLRRAHPAAAGVVERLAAPGAVAGRTVLAADAAAGATSLLLAAGGIAAAGDLLRITPPVGGPYFHVMPAAAATLTPVQLTLAPAVDGSHAAFSMIAPRTPILAVRALDAGQWGNRLRVAMERQDPPTHTPVLTTTVRQTLPGGRLRLDSASGVEAGTELILTDAAATAHHVKVSGIDRQNDFLITLEAATPLPPTVAVGDGVRSVEYRFVVELLRQPDPANPARNGVAIDREVFANLSLDFRHSRYFQRVIGSFWPLDDNTAAFDAGGRPLRRSDRRSEGESSHVRVSDLVAGATGLRTGPQADYEIRPGSPPRLILLPLSGGNDALATFLAGEMSFIGTDNANPEQRTGLQTLRNIEDISIVAAPGRTAAAMQGALIAHCELLRYRFAVLDGSPPPRDGMADIQAQRQQFDTKYAALYHPWLLVPDPYPVSAGTAADAPIPPSGHMVGIYARTDIERGVHKAPANEVVRGITGLQRLLNKEQHDILNPYPVNINVIRDFRSNNRGIRVYGGRVITSDSDWKYVNVRRLLIFIEASVDRGLQWVVFEPNAEPLWARVRRSITNFLTLVWRNGALEGTKPEEAFFVKCDRTTMTQTDIDSGRLICLVGVAPVKPAEFVIVRIGLWTAHADE